MDQELDRVRDAAMVQGHVGVVLGTVMTSPAVMELRGARVGVWCPETGVAQIEARWYNITETRWVDEVDVYFQRTGKQKAMTRVVGRAAEIPVAVMVMLRARQNAMGYPHVLRVELVDETGRALYSTYLDEVDERGEVCWSVVNGHVVRVMEDDLDLECVGVMNQGVMTRKVVGTGPMPTMCSFHRCRQKKLRGVLVDVESRSRKGACVKHWLVMNAMSGWVVEEEYEVVEKKVRAR